jgi:hypothetical protein
MTVSHMTYHHKCRDLRVINKVYKVLGLHHIVKIKIVNLNADTCKKNQNYTKCEVIPQLYNII